MMLSMEVTVVLIYMGIPNPPAIGTCRCSVKALTVHLLWLPDSLALLVTDLRLLLVVPALLLSFPAMLRSQELEVVMVVVIQMVVRGGVRIPLPNLPLHLNP